jgi:uncharacterized protein YcnI
MVRAAVTTRRVALVLALLAMAVLAMNWFAADAHAADKRTATAGRFSAVLQVPFGRDWAEVAMDDFTIKVHNNPAQEPLARQPSG